MKKSTKGDFLKLIESINVNEKEKKKPERKVRVTRYGTSYDPDSHKINDNADKDVIIGAPVCVKPI